tara:strand:+ start:151 stop:534 length:384 start_codon:yes stop_codon:yes gene_type:complete
MDEKITLTVAIANVNSTLEILKDNPSYNILSSQLNSVKLILESQLNESEPTVTIPENVEQSEPKDVVSHSSKVNTYSIQELVTTGWVLVDKKLINLKKEDASKEIQNLIDNESYNPNDLRVVVDGQI